MHQLLKKSFLTAFTCICLAAMSLAHIAMAGDSVWDDEQEILLVRGVGIMNSNDPASYYAVMKLSDTSQGNWIFEVKEIGVDQEPGDGVYYPENGQLNFMLPLGDTNLDIWMKLVQGDSGRLFAILLSA